MINVYNSLEGRKTLEQETLGRQNHRWEGNIKIEFKEIASEGVDWIQLAQVKSSGGLI
jgi:hypothetical protein